MSTPRIQWFARGGGISRMGPYKTHIEAAQALVLAASKPGVPLFPDNAFVWPEPVRVKKKVRKS